MRAAFYALDARGSVTNLAGAGSSALLRSTADGILKRIKEPAEHAAIQSWLARSTSR
jgi:hypothetical protein